MIVFDVETSGLDEKTNGVIGLGAIILPGGDTFYNEPRLADDLTAHPRALEVNGFTEEEIRSPDRPDMATVLQRFSDWAVGADDMILGGWNGTFDYRFLAAEYARTNKRWPFKYRVVDIQTAAYLVMRIKDNWTPMHDGVSTVGLNYTLKWLGLPPEPEPHNALTGAQCNVDVLLALTKMIQVVDNRFEDQKDGADEAEQLTLIGPATHIPTSTGGTKATIHDHALTDEEAYKLWLESQMD